MINIQSNCERQTESPYLSEARSGFNNGRGATLTVYIEDKLIVVLHWDFSRHGNHVGNNSDSKVSLSVAQTLRQSVSAAILWCIRLNQSCDRESKIVLQPESPTSTSWIAQDGEQDSTCSFTRAISPLFLWRYARYGALPGQCTAIWSLLGYIVLLIWVLVWRSDIRNSFVMTKVCFQALPMAQFTTLQKGVSPF